MTDSRPRGTRFCALGFILLICIGRMSGVVLAGPQPEAEAPEPVVTSIAESFDVSNPANTITIVNEVDPARLGSAEGVKRVSSAEELASRAALPCQSVVYQNLPPVGPYLSTFQFGGVSPTDNAADDCALSPFVVNRFLCAAQVRTFGANRYHGAATYDVRIQVWDRCPEESGAVLIQQGSFLSIANDDVERIQTLTIDPPYSDDDGLVYVRIQSDNPDASIINAAGTTDAGDVGSTSTCFLITNSDGSCANDSFCGGNTALGVPVTLFGSAGSAGSCCDLTTGTCTDGVFQADCVNPTTQSWSALACANRTDCVVCSPPTCPVSGAPNLENEPDCSANYNDITNRGCSGLATGNAVGFTPITCGQSGCGRSGTYTFLNQGILEGRRDDDHYLLALTQDTRVTWKVRGQFPSEAIVSFTVRQTNSTSPLYCPTYVSNAVGDVSVASASSCQESTATVCLPGGGALGYPLRYLLRARPATPRFGAADFCGLPYTVLLSCQPCSLPTGACCTTTGCVQVSRLACLIATGSDTRYYQGDGTTCPNGACTGAPANDTCPNAIVLTCTNCIVAYDTTYANGEGQTFGQSGQVQKDVWFKYIAPQPGGCTNGRIVVSNIGTCFNSKIQLLRISNCSASATSQCSLLTIGGGFTPIPFIAGPPAVNVGSFVYGRSSLSVTPGQCYFIRTGGVTDNDFGPGLLRAEFICNTPQAGSAWSLQTGRCCFPDGSCMVAPYDQTSGASPICCASLGGYLRFSTDFREGQPPSGFGNAAEVAAAGCSVLPCPAAGEACYNALDFNSLVGSDFGTINRNTKNRLYYKYAVPPTAAIGSGLAIETCGSDYDTAIAVYRGFDLTSGECFSEGAPQGPGTQACTGVAFDNSELSRADDCAPSDPSSASSIDRASCYQAGEHTSCTCLRVIASGQTPVAGEVARGSTIWIGIGLKNTLQSSSRPFLDPVRADACGASHAVRLAISNPASCFTCSVTCPGGATAENEPLPGPTCDNYLDVTNAGCRGVTASTIQFTPITCGQTYCGTSGTFRTNRACFSDEECVAGDACLSNVCVGTGPNTRDSDYYRIQITQASRLTWTVNATFAATLQIIASPTNTCVDQHVVATNAVPTPCATTSCSADVCPGWYYLLVEPTTLNAVPCGSLYYATLTCTSLTSPACCKGDVNNDGQVNGGDIGGWLGQLAAPVGMPDSVIDPLAGCMSSKVCAGDFTGDFQVDLTDVSGFVAALLATNSCDATVCGDPAGCHVVSAADSGEISDISATTTGGPSRCADDFRVVTGTSLSHLCWWGFYYDQSATLACATVGGDSADVFSVTIYSSSSGLPNMQLAGPVAPINVVKIDSGVDLSHLGQPVRRFRYEADLPSALAVTPGTCYWIEIVNHTGGACAWEWETSYVSGNGLAVRKANAIAGAMNWYNFDLVESDFAFCLPGLRIDGADCGLPTGRCCTYGPGNPFGTCSLATRPACETALGGKWTFNTDCTSPCPVEPTGGGCPGEPTQSVGPDVAVVNITGPSNFNSSGTLEAITLGSDACNVGNQPASWDSCPANGHPIFGGNMYKWSTVGGATRFEQIGQSWLKNGFAADQAHSCCTNCQPAATTAKLGIGCSDAYLSNQAAVQNDLSPKSSINAHTGLYPPGCAVHPAGANGGYLQMEMADLVATNGGTGAPVRYFVQHQYLTFDDAFVHNQNNNASSREIAVSGAGAAWDFFFPPFSVTQFQIPAVRLWRQIDPGVVETDIMTPEDDGFPGLIIMAAKATDLGGGTWRYEYAVNNLNSDRSIRLFSVPCSAGATVSNIGFHDVAYRNGDGVGGVNYDGTDWPGAIGGGAVSWATSTFVADNNANAIRWGTLYNFRFDVDRAPQPGGGTVTLGQYKAGGNVTTTSVVPGP